MKKQSIHWIISFFVAITLFWIGIKDFPDQWGKNQAENSIHSLNDISLPVTIEANASLA